LIAKKVGGRRTTRLGMDWWKLRIGSFSGSAAEAIRPGYQHSIAQKKKREKKKIFLVQIFGAGSE